ncbi:hypothetical protein FRC08_002239 [Ceratobasidium sp. 394]|nr:hypothetical protein FRC08_002239 [Ceratobasidium sp. 394]
MVAFVLLFDPSSSTPSCASSLVHCGFKCEPATRYTALGTPTHVLLYAESACKTIARRIDVRSMRRRWAASSSTSAGAECVDLGIKLLGTPRSRFFVGNPGTEGAQFYTTVRVTLRRKMPKWLRRHDPADVLDDEPRTRRRNQPITVSAFALSVDAENRTTDLFQGIALGSHDIEPDTESDESESECDSSAQFQSRARTLPDSYNLPTPSQSSLLAPVPAPDPTPVPAAVEKQQSNQLLLRRPFRRVCRVRYKRTIFPAHVNYAHELAGIGSFGRYAAWIEGDGIPEDVDLAKEPLRVVVAPLEWEKGGEPGKEWDEEGERRRVGDMARVVNVLGTGMRDKLNLVSCVAMEDAVGVIAMATMDGQVVVGSLV